MKWAAQDYYRWRFRFAFMPRQIGEQWIWLEYFEWRLMRPDEEMKIYKYPALYGPWGGMTRCFRQVIGVKPEPRSYFWYA